MTQTLKNYSFHIQIGTIATCLIFIISGTAWTVSVKKDMDKTLDSVVIKYNHVDKWIDSVEVEQERLREETQKLNLDMVEIKTKLTNIEALLLEIKHKI